ncbi:MAG: signal transduction histidine kinase nitrogen specific NtrB [Limisphaerales bacterium]|nr:MAG: signal transduction histidine kinase nitrogen specific NtrB [Limisphaerales bacterium]
MTPTSPAPSSPAGTEEVERLRLALRAANVGLWDWDLRTAQMRFSPEWKSQLGHAEDEIGDNFQEFEKRLHPEDTERVKRVLQEYLEHPSPEGHTVEFRLRHKDGSYRWILAHGSVVSGPDGQPVRMLGSHVDITARKLAEEALQRSRERLRSIIEAEPECVKIVGRGGELQDINPMGLTFLEAGSIEEARSRPLMDYILPPYRAAFADVHQRVLQGQRIRIEYECEGLRGTRRWLETQAVPFPGEPGEETSLLSITRDVSERKRTELLLRESEQKFGTLFRNSPAAIALITPEDGLILEANESYCQLVGYTHGELVGHTVFELNLNADPAFRQQVVQELLQVGRKRGISTAYRHRSGELRQVVVSSELIELSGRRVILAISQDITDLHRTQQLLRSTEKRVEAIVQSVDGIVWEANPQTFQFTFISPQAERLLGYPLAQWTAARDFWAEHIHPDDREQAVNYCQARTRQGLNHDFEYRMIAADGRILWIRDLVTVVMEGDQPARLRGIMVDITDRKETEAALRQRNALLQTVVESTTDPIFAKDLAGRYQLLNTACAKALGAPIEHILGHTDADLLPAETANTFRETDDEVMVTGESVTREESGQMPDGVHHWQAKKSPWRDADGRLLGIIGVSRDITAQKEAEAALRHSSGILHQAQQIAQIGSWHLDLLNNVLIWSPETHRIFGVPEGAPLTYGTFMECVHPEDRADVNRSWQAALHGEPYQIEHRIVVGGQTKWVREQADLEFDFEGNLIAGVGTVQDITASRQAELALREAKLRFQTLFDLAPVGVVVIDPETAHVLECNEHAARQLGYPMAEFQRLRIPDFEAVERPEETRARIRQMMSEGGATFETQHRTKTGNIRDVWVRAQVIDLAGRKVCHCIFQDITDRKRNERRSAILTALAGKLNATSRPQDAARVIADAADQLLGWDACTLDLYDHATGQLTSLLNMDLIAGRRQEAPPTRDPVTPTLRQRRAIEQGGELILRDAPLAFVPDARPFGDVTRPSASILLVPIRDDRNVIGLFSIQSYRLQAYNEGDLQVLQAMASHCGEALIRMQSSEALAAVEAKYRTIVENAVEGIFQTTPEGRFLTVNTAMARMLGYGSPKEMLAANMDIARQLFVRPAEREEFRQRLERDGSVTGFEYECFRRDGSRVWLSESARAVRDETGRTTCYEGVVEDITARRRKDALLLGQKQVLEMIASDRPLKQTLEALLHLVESQVPGFICCISLLDEDGHRLRHGAAPSLPHAFWQAFDGLAIGPDTGTCGAAVFRNSPVTAEDLARDPLTAPFSELAARHNLRACSSIPIHTEEFGIVGVFAVYLRQPGRPDAGHQQLIELVTHTAAIAMVHHREREALNKSRTQLLLANQAAKVGAWDWDLATGEMSFSEGWWRLLGYTEQERTALRESWDARLHPQDHGRTMAALHACREGELAEYEVEFRVRHRDGSYRWMFSRGRLLRDAAGRSVRLLGCNLDITQAKQAEQRLTIFATLGRQLNLCTDRREAALTIVNMADEIFGWDACSLDFCSEETGRCEPVLHMDLINGRRQEVEFDTGTGQMPPTMSRVFQSGKSELILRAPPVTDPPLGFTPFGDTSRPSASLMFVPIRNENRAMGMLSIQSYRPRAYNHDDLAALESLADYCGGALLRICGREQIRESQERFRQLAETIQDVFWLTDPERNEMLYISPAYEGVWGRTCASLYDAPGGWLESIHPDDRERVQQAAQALRQEGNYDEEYRILRPDGSLCWIRDRAYPVRDAAGRIVRIAGVARDISDRKSMQEALRASEEQFENLFESAPDAIIVATDSGQIQMINREAEKMFGYTRHELLGQSLETLMPQRYAEGHANLREGYVKDARQRAMARCRDLSARRKDGTEFSVDISLSPMRTPHGLMVISTIRDITDRKRMEQNLRASNENFLNLFESSPDAIVVAERGGAIRSINRQAEVLFGYSREEILGQPIEILMPKRFQNHARLREEYARNPHVRLMGEGRSLWARRKDDTEFPADISLSPITTSEGMMVISIVRDVTKRKEAEDQVRKLAAFPELNPNPVLEFSADAALTYSNRAAKEVAQRICGGEITDLLPLQIKSVIANCLATGQPHLRMETRLGSHTLSWSFYPITDQQTVHCYVGDITERLKLEAQWHQSQKMEAIGQLAGGIAHDFNNILGAIIGNVDLIQMSEVKDASMRESLDTIMRASRRAADLVKQILTFSRQQEQQRHPLQLHLVVREALKLLRATVPATVEFQDALVKAPIVLADPSQIHQVVMNLCTNAWHALGDKPGVIRVELQEVVVTPEQAAQHPDLRVGRYVCLRISDTGSGMDRATLERIFEPFFTTKPVGVGTGLGLAVVHGIVKKHDGAIAVQSQPGQGTTFELFFPVIDNSGGEKCVETAERLPQGHGERILLVDDEEALVSLGRRFLERLGYQPVTALGPIEALSIFQEQPQTFSLVITDFNMPGMNGLVLAQKMREVRPDIRILVATGYSAALSNDAVRDLGLSELLPKPYDMQTLSEFVQRAIVRPSV